MSLWPSISETVFIGSHRLFALTHTFACVTSSERPSNCVAFLNMQEGTKDTLNPRVRENKRKNTLKLFQTSKWFFKLFMQNDLLMLSIVLIPNQSQNIKMSYCFWIFKCTLKCLKMDSVLGGSTRLMIPYECNGYIFHVPVSCITNPYK